MATVFAEQSVSLDGFSAGGNIGPTNPLGDRGEELHRWMFEGETPGILRDSWSGIGAVILGQRMFELGWEPWGHDNPWGKPAFVLTHLPKTTISPPGGRPFTFVTEGIHRALEQAGEAAGNRPVAIAGGASTVQQYLRAGLVDELYLHIVPIILGNGIRLLDGVDGTSIQAQTDVLGTTMGTVHLRYRIARRMPSA
ncbi:MAG TPA: dihydrofolate reductase family protein [Thermomicrobiales bacterium]|nr:dihydrofolate reductase family protein [Thermomicrobiales bacterium]